MTDTDHPQITTDMAGCWLDGAMGWHNAYRVIDRAEEYGFVVPAEYAADLEAFRSSAYENDAHHMNVNESINGQGELSDMATVYLDERAPDGYEFLWDAGELSLVESWMVCAAEGNGCTEDERCADHEGDA